MELDNVHLTALWGFLGAIIFGIVASKTHFCTMGSISDWIFMGSRSRFRAWILAIGIALLGSQIMQALGWIDLSETFYLSSTLAWLGYVLGGFLFGVGMTLGAGCGQRTLVRVGSGNLKSLVVLLVLAITAYMTLRGLLAYVRIDWVGAMDVDLSTHDLSEQSIPSLLSYITGLNTAITLPVVTILFGLGALIYAFASKDFRQSKDNILAGVVVGLLVAGGWYVTGVLGFDDFEPIALESVTFISPTGNTLNYLMTYTGSVINFGIATVFGMIVGSFIYAVSSKTFRIETFTNRSDMINHLLAGVLMGFGGVLAFGCTIGQGVTGMSTLALGSLMATISIVLGCAVTLKMQYYLLDEYSWFAALRQTLSDLRLIPKAAARS